ncbi:MAG: bifunctional oligoribonuclease/PAP phosphatase NrnA [Pseudobdellovibrionaceae bacterium]
MKTLASRIRSAQSILLSTHRQCDGDGLGAQLALFHAFKAGGKDVHVVNVDATPRKYRFLQPDRWIQYFEKTPTLPDPIDLALIFDTNDERLVEPLFSPLKKMAKLICFIDHHPVLKQGPRPTKESWIDVTSASTGEMAYRMIKELGLPINRDVARCLYTSITFDTQLYRFVRNSPMSHRIAAEMMEHGIDTEEIHRHLFGNQTVQKMAFLARALGQIEYFSDGKLAVLRLKDADLFHYNLEPDDSRDVIDMLMNIESLEAAALFREDDHNKYKISLRSKGKIEVLSVAENIGGGGHVHAAGAFVEGDYETIKEQVVNELISLLDQSPALRK